MKKMTSYIVAGVKADDEKVFMQRVGEILERNNLLDQLAEGVPVSATIVDEAEFLEWLQNQNKNKHNIEVKENGISLCADGRVQVGYKYTITRYYKTQEDADKKNWECIDHPSEDYPIVAERPDSHYVCVDQNTPGVKILYI